MKARRIVTNAIALVSLAALGPAPAIAGSTGGTLNVAAKVAKKCTIAAQTNLSFADYDPSYNDDMSANFNVYCSKGTTPSVVFDVGGNSTNAPTGSTRAMTDGATTPSFLGYDLYTTSGYGTVWDTTTPQSVGASSGMNTALTFTVYGRIPQGQNVPDGDYTDSVNITVNF